MKLINNIKNLFGIRTYLSWAEYQTLINKRDYLKFVTETARKSLKNLPFFSSFYHNSTNLINHFTKKGRVINQNRRLR